MKAIRAILLIAVVAFGLTSAVKRSQRCVLPLRRLLRILFRMRQVST